MSLLDTIHGSWVYRRRLSRLRHWIAPLLPETGRLLDIGCGDGALDALLQERRPDLQVEGIDVLVRPETRIPVKPFDGRTVPFADGTFDAVLLVDVLHHTDDPAVLLREARRVSRRWVVLKDHFRDGLLAGPTLRFMDRVGNARHGVALPSNYWPRTRWETAWQDIGLEPETLHERLGLYPPPFTWAFDRSLHFVARLEVKDASKTATGPA